MRPRRSQPVSDRCRRSALPSLIALLFLSIAAPAALAGQALPLPQATSPAHPASLAAPAVDVAAVVAYIEEARRAWEVPGLAVAIVKDGEVVLERGFGVRHHERGGAVDAHTLFAIASNTKAFTAATLALLVAEGRVSWDDPVRRHLPWFDVHDPWVSSAMTVRDLLSHRAGYTHYSGDLLWYGTGYTAEEVVRRARHLAPVGPFRAHYGYSNLMYITAGEVVHAAAGRPWPEVVRERLLRPLGMTRTVVLTSELEGVDNVATPHGEWRGQLRAFPWQPWDAMAAAGGLISSVHDMAKWLRFQLALGEAEGGRLLEAAAIREMWTPHNPLRVTEAARRRVPSTHFRAYGLGWSLNDYLGREIVGHGGAYDGMYSRTVLVPEERLGIVILTNGMTGIATPIGNRILDAYLAPPGAPLRDWSAELLPEARAAERREAERRAAAVARAATGTRPSLALDAYAGTYTGPLYGDVVVAREGTRLVLRMAPAPELVADLTHLHHDVFLVEWRRPWPWFDRGTAHFVLDRAGAVAELKLDVPNQDFWFHELELRRVR
jgi:CubicO group peptidase (beta-lactamase class C family)